MVAIVFIILDHETVWFSKVKQQASVIITPIQYAVDGPIFLARSISQDISSQQHLIKEDTQLHEQLLFLHAHMQKLLALKQENKQLKALLKAAASTSGHFTEASVLAVSPKPYLHHIVLNKGEHQDVYQGQPVLDAHGVMGQITQVNATTSVVALITDTQSRVPVQDARSGVRAVIDGIGHFKQLKLRYITQSMDIKQGDQLITSGLGGVYPYGYPVGTVTAIKPDADSKFKDIKVKPAAHLDRSRLVMLYWQPSSAKEAVHDHVHS